MKLTRELRVKNRLGLHARPATYIAKLLQPCTSSVSFTTEKETINAKSVLGILMLAATKNTKIDVTIEGEDAEHVMNLVITAFENRFGET